ncbi:FG-GAP repeat protein [Planctomycetes bacterium Poly30]|uniref:FG-GAP repeat protein n=1 Tax=Saltatorellus ferox TaxID=2528018 RepID=A0A518F0V9_9BACT|nr:FG-GAP repeat protein [Planctomycetes bacterium Poly30]
MIPFAHIAAGCSGLAAASVLSTSATFASPIAPQSSAADLFEIECVDFLDSSHRLEIPADLDGDGRVELVGWWSPSTSFNHADFHVLRQDPASGAWTETTTFLNTGAGAYSGDTHTIAGDFDGDGGDEILILHLHGYEVIDTDSAMQPTRVATSAAAFALSGTVREAAAFDMNADGLDDLVIVDGASVRLLLSTSVSGQIDFSLSDQLPSYGGEVRMAGIQVSGTVTPELILLQDHAHPAVWTLHVENGEFGPGTRIFSRATTGGQRIDLAPGDLDADGDVDAVLFGHDGSYEVLRNHGGVLALEASRVGGPATALADLDGDGDLDGICCGGSGVSQYNNGVSVFHLSLNAGDVQFESAIAFDGLGAHHVTGALDFDLDGDVDVLAGRAVLLNRDEIGASFCDATVNGSGQPAELHVTGRASILAGGPQITGSALPSSTTCILLASSSLDPVAPWPFWDGQLCLGTHQLRRLRVATADAGGGVNMGGSSDWSTGGFQVGASPGLPFTYQIWFRDVTPGGSGANVTDASRILLTL